jgi:hypothetical protein
MGGAWFGSWSSRVASCQIPCSGAGVEPLAFAGARKGGKAENTFGFGIMAGIPGGLQGCL